MKVRIGIDVGGTFTDAVAINDETYELIGSTKSPTTHTAKEGVALGIVNVLKKIMKNYEIKAEDICFIAHGTTQATNALLEGDVAKVGILTLGTGLEGIKSKSDTFVGKIGLGSGKFIDTTNVYVNTSPENELNNNINKAIEELLEQDSEAIVGTEAFSVDNPDNENNVLAKSKKFGIPATVGNDVSKLYGLKVRTRTAVINASILPKMLETANMTEESIINSKIQAPLMVMRCDGGVMTIDEVRSRPILTILSGPAAGVAGALMYEKLTDGIFFEVGGTSTDISCIKDGKVEIKYAEIGGHNTYLNSIDVRTVGIGGGSMIQIKDGQMTEVGPRSAHIANLDYEVYAKEDEIVDPVLRTVKPLEGDQNYAYVECSNGKSFALTLSGAANICGYVRDEDYAKGNISSAKKAWEPLAQSMKMSVEEAAQKALDLSAANNGKIVNDMIKDYNLDRSSIIFVGGGGGASTVVPHIAETFDVKHKLAKNADVISPIGVALAMVRDMVERTISNPSEEDILSIREEAKRMVIQSGASPETVEVTIEVEPRVNKLRAIAIGTTELRTKDLSGLDKTDDELKEIVAQNLKVGVNEVKIEADNGMLCAITTTYIKRQFLIFKKEYHPTRLVDRQGVIRLQKKNADVRLCQKKDWKRTINKLLEEFTNYSDGGAEVPNIYIALGSRIIDLSGMKGPSQITAISEVELAGVPTDAKLIMVCTLTTENERG